MSAGAFHPDLAPVRLLLERVGLGCADPVPEETNSEYGGCVFDAGGMRIRFRAGKVTPTKSGLFVATWRRGEDGTSEPFDDTEGVDYLVVGVRENSRFGVFVFPAPVLVDHGIVAGEGTGGRRSSGKRGFRLYPPWSATTSRQAQTTQRWQRDHFIDLTDVDDPEWIRQAHSLFAGGA